jgi:hypothetical protein
MTRLLKPLLLRFMPLLLTGIFLLPQALPAQTADPSMEEADGGEDKEKKKKEKKVKEPKAPKEKKQKPDKNEDGGDGQDAGDADVGEESGDPEAKRESGDATPPKDLIGGVDDTTRVSVSCLRYKTGYMEYIDKNYEGIKIKRKGKKEFWTNTIDGNKLVFKIDWLSHNHYVLNFVKAKLPSRFKKGYVLDCEMVACYDEYYDCDCQLNGIAQYGSVNKTPTKQEIATRQRQDREKLEQQEAAQAKAVQDSIAKANAPVIDPDAPPAPTPPPAEAKAKGDKAVKGDKAEGDKPAKAPKEKKAKAAKKEKAPKEKKEKADKAPKPEKLPKTKPEKQEKPPKEKKEKREG